MTKYIVTAEVNRYRQRIGVYDSLEEARIIKEIQKEKYPYSKPKITSV